MLTKEDKQFIARMKSRAKMIMEKDGSHITLAILTNEEGQYLVPLKFKDDREKEIMLILLRREIKEKKIDNYLIINEAWYSHNQMIRPSQDPDRKEMIVLVFFKRDMTFYSLSMPFTRDGKKIKWLEEVKEEDRQNIATIWDFYTEKDAFDEKFDNLLKTKGGSI